MMNILKKQNPLAGCKPELINSRFTAFLRNGINSISYKRSLKLIPIVFLSIIIPLSSLNALTPVILDDTAGMLKPGRFMEILEDPAGKLTIDEVIRPEMNSKWFPSRSDSPNFGKSKSAYWFRFEIINNSPDKYFLLKSDWPLYDKIDLFFLSGDSITKKQYGNIYPFRNRDKFDNYFVFNLPEKTKKMIIILRVETETSVQMPLSILTQDTYEIKSKNDIIFKSIFFGIILVMFCYNLLLFISLKDLNYLFYIIYLFFQITFHLSYFNLGFQFIWPDSPYFNMHSMPFLLGGVAITSLLFAKRFLNIDWRYKKLCLYYYIFISLFIITMTWSLFSIYTPLKLINLLGFLWTPSLIFSSIYMYNRGFKAARFFLSSWIVMLIGTLILIGKNLGLIPVNFFSTNSSIIGISFEVVFLSFALADRINILKQEKSLAQDEIIEIQKLYSQSLEKTVNVRTLELESERNKLKSKNEIMENDVALARKIQDQLIPVPDPTDYIYSFYKPMQEVGGDLYDFVNFRDSEKIGIFISDVSGHGVPAAFITSMIKTTILQSGNRKENPSALMEYINDVLHNQTAGNFITAFYGIFDTVTKSLLYCNAGHPLPYLITDNGILQLPKGNNTALALFSNDVLECKNKKYLNFHETLPRNSKVLFYTDGLTEACPIDGDSFFENNAMKNVLHGNRILSPELFIDKLFESLTAFRKSDSFEDDVCMVCLDVR